MTGTVEFWDGGIRYLSYPYLGASVYPHGNVSPADIRDADPDAAPPEIRTHRGETLFLSADRRDDFRAFCEAHGVAIVSRPDVWGDLLEPFLDTPFGPSDEQRTGTRLAAAGLGRNEIEQIRQDVGEAMLAYNFDSMLWDWAHLGLFDLLEAQSGRLAGERFRLPPEDFVEFYWVAMAVADRSYDQNSSQA